VKRNYCNSYTKKKQRTPKIEEFRPINKESIYEKILVKKLEIIVHSQLVNYLEDNNY